MDKRKKGLLRGPLIYLLIMALVIALALMLGQPPRFEPTELEYTEFLRWVEDDLKHAAGLSEDGTHDIAVIRVVDTTVTALKQESTIPLDSFDSMYDVVAKIPSEERLLKDINNVYENTLGREVSPTDYEFTIQTREPAGRSWLLEWLPYLISLALFGLMWFIIMRGQMGAGGNKGVMNFGHSRARLTDPSKNNVTFADVAGADEEKEELKEIVEFLKDPKRFLDLGARIPKGVLLVGPPGTGKTLLARAVSGEAKVPFFTISGSDFVEMFVGVGASRVRDLFDQAKKASPSIIFIDEIDAVGRQRGTGLGGGHDEREQTLNQLLVEMDGFSHNEGVIVMAATNRQDVLDPALLRPGRFDRQITINYPDVKGREEILKVHAKGKPLAGDVDLAVLARRTPYFTGADLENVLNEGAILTARAHKNEIDMPTIEEAITRVSVGPEKKSRKITDKDKKLVSYHEAGHAIVSYFIPECDKVHEVSIIPRGQAAGYTMYLPQEELNHITSSKLRGEMASLLAGHCAEELKLGDVTTGSTSDLKRATEIARGMVTEYGMSSELGPIFLGGEHEVFLGRDFSQSRPSFSEEVNNAIDKEIRALLDTAMARAKSILTEHNDKLEALAAVLIEREKIDAAQFERLMNGLPVDAEAVADDTLPAEETGSGEEI